MFTSYPDYNPYRVLYDRSDTGLPLLGHPNGDEDVYALQSALNYMGAGLVLDGIFGPRTGKAVWDTQPKLGFTGSQIDGKAGQQTQRRLALAILGGLLKPGTRFYRLEVGQIEHESSFLLGNYSGLRPDNTFDAGVVQRNSKFHDLRNAFDPVDSIKLLVDRVTKARQDYKDTSQFRPHLDDPEERRLKLAAGSWNAPAFANYYAGVQPWAVPSPAGAEAFLSYIEDIAVYL